MKTLPNFNNTQNIDYTTNLGGARVGIEVYPLRGFPRRLNVFVKLDCISNDCPRGGKRKASDDRAVFTYPEAVQPGDEKKLLQGKFRVTAYVPVKKKDKIVYKSRYKEYEFDPSRHEKVQLNETGCLKPGVKRFDDSKKGKPKTTVGCRGSK